MKLLLIFAITTTLGHSLCRGQGVITTVAGTGTCCNGSDGLPATSAWLPGLAGITMDRLGNLYIWDASSSKVRKVNTAGIISTVAGNGTPGAAGDGGPATSAQLFGDPNAAGLAVDGAGNLYISDGNNHRVRKVDTAGIISTVAGSGTPGFSGDGGPATSATLFYPTGIALDSSDNLYIADSSNNRVRKVTPAGTISTFAGNGNVSYSGDGIPAIATAVDRPEGVTVDSAGNLYIAETSQSRVRKVNAAGIISTFAGQTAKTNGFSGDGGPATRATLYGPIGLAVDSAGNLYIADNRNGRIRKVDAAGIITTVAGNGASGFSGDGGPATSASLGVPIAVALDSGNLYIGGSAAGAKRVRKVSATGPSISMSPSSLSFSYTIGGAIPVSPPVSVSSSGAALSFTAAASSSVGNWLTVSPNSGTTPATLNISINPAGLPGGIYQGAITLTPSGGGNSPQTFAVSLTVNGAGAPAFTGSSVLNATGYQAVLAPDTVFVIFGSGMGPSTLSVASAPNYPTSLDGASITFTPVAGGSAIDAKMVYAGAGQVAGLLPSSIAPGTYAVRVTYNTLTSVPQNVTVVARSFGIATANGGGTGTAQATIGSVNGGLSLTRFTSGSVDFNGFTWTLTPAHPGDTLILWGTGGGADPANDAGGTSGDQTAAGNFIVNVGGRQITPLYAGASSGYPGLWQINFTLPSDIAPDCFAPLRVSAGGELSNAVSIPIAAAGQTACSDPNLSPAILARIDAGRDFTLAAFALARIRDTSANVTVESGSGAVFRFKAAKYALSFSGPKFGSCVVYDRTYPVGGLDPASPESFLDAGPRLPLSGPNLLAGAALASVVSPFGPTYAFLPAAGAFTSGTYTLTGNGGTQVGGFGASTVFPSSFTVTNWDAVTVIDRSRPLTFNWTGSGFDQVSILASTATRVGSNLHIATITCLVPAGPGAYSIPAGALAYLQPAATTGASFGVVSVQARSAQENFTAPLVGGGQTDIGVFGANLGVSKNIAVQ